MSTPRGKKVANKGTRMKFSSEYEPDLRRLVIDAPNAVADLDIDIENHYPNLHTLEIVCKELTLPYIPDRVKRMSFDIRMVDIQWTPSQRVLAALQHCVEHLEMSDIEFEELDVSAWSKLIYVDIFCADHLKNIQLPPSIEKMSLMTPLIPFVDVQLLRRLDEQLVLMSCSAASFVMVPRSLDQLTICSCNKMIHVDWMDSHITLLRIVGCEALQLTPPQSIVSLVVFESKRVEIADLQSYTDLDTLAIGVLDLMRVQSLPLLAKLVVYYTADECVTVDITDDGLVLRMMAVVVTIITIPSGFSPEIIIQEVVYDDDGAFDWTFIYFPNFSQTNE